MKSQEKMYSDEIREAFIKKYGTCHAYQGPSSEWWIMLEFFAEGWSAREKESNARAEKLKPFAPNCNLVFDVAIPEPSRVTREE